MYASDNWMFTDSDESAQGLFEIKVLSYILKLCKIKDIEE
jgi:hypothetical protein